MGLKTVVNKLIGRLPSLSSSSLIAMLAVGFAGTVRSEVIKYHLVLADS